MKDKKKKGLAIAGSTSVATTGTGIALMAFGGPTGIVVGGIILGAGLSGTISTAQQALNKEEDFDYKKWSVQAGIGAAGGLIAAPISLAGGALAGAGGTIATSTAAKASIQIGADVLSGVASGAGTKALANHFEGKKLGQGVLNHALIGGITGGIASGAGQGASKIIGHVEDQVGRIAVQTTTGALISGTTGGLGCLLQNILNIRKINQQAFIDYLQKCGASKNVSAQIWSNLCSKQYIVNNEFTRKCDKGIILDCEFIHYQDIVNEIFLLTQDIWQDVWESAASSAALGGVVTGIVTTTRVLNQQEGKTVNKTMNNLKPKSNKQIIEEIKEYEPCNLEEYECQDEHDWILIDELDTCDSFQMQKINRNKRGAVRSKIEFEEGYHQLPNLSDFSMKSSGIGFDEGHHNLPRPSEIRENATEVYYSMVSNDVIRERRESIIQSYLNGKQQQHELI